MRLEQDYGEAIVMNGMPYRRVGPETLLQDDNFPNPPGADDMYNFVDVRFPSTDANNKRYWTAAECAVAFATANHNRSAPVNALQGIKTPIFYCDPLGVGSNGGSVAVFTGFGGQVGGVTYWMDDKTFYPNGNSNYNYIKYMQGGYSDTTSSDMSVYVMDSANYFGGQTPIYMNPGQTLYLTFANNNNVPVYYAFLPNGYP